ncbi:DUF4153 domain-containing protein [Fusibacter bizertensis]
MKKLRETMRFILGKLKRSSERFPLTLVMTFLLMVATILLAHLDYSSEQQDLYQKIALTFALGIPMTAAGKVLIERYRLDSTKKYGVEALAVVLILLYYLMLPETLTPYFAMRYMALWSILFFAFLLIPYFHDREGLSRYVLHLVGRFFLTMLYAGVILLGVFMIIFSIEKLFDVNWWNEIYMDAFIIIACAFGVTYFLGSVPEQDSVIPTEGFSKVFKGLFLYILIPILSIYTVILYAYFIKVLFSFKLPEGVIGNLVLWYALVSIITLFFVRDLRDEVPWLSKFFKFYIPLLSIPLVMLYIALFIRINAFGLTMPRYFVVALAVFSTITAGLMWRVKKDTAVISMILLVTFIAIAFFGPLSGYNLTLSSQTKQLEGLLKANDMLSNSGQLLPNADVSKESQIEISKKITFLVDAYTIDQIKVLPKTFNDETAKQYLGFELQSYWYSRPEAVKRFSYYEKNPVMLIPLDDAEYMLNTEKYVDLPQTNMVRDLTIKNDKDNLVIRENRTILMTVDLNENAAIFYLNQEKPLTITSQNQKIKMTLIYTSVDGEVLSDQEPTSTDDLKIDYFNVRILIDLMP